MVGGRFAFIPVGECSVHPLTRVPLFHGVPVRPWARPKQAYAVPGRCLQGPARGAGAPGRRSARLGSDAGLPPVLGIGRPDARRGEGRPGPLVDRRGGGWEGRRAGHRGGRGARCPPPPPSSPGSAPSGPERATLHRLVVPGFLARHGLGLDLGPGVGLGFGLGLRRRPLGPRVLGVCVATGPPHSLRPDPRVPEAPPPRVPPPPAQDASNEDRTHPGGPPRPVAFRAFQSSEAPSRSSSKDAGPVSVSAAVAHDGVGWPP